MTYQRPDILIDNVVPEFIQTGWRTLIHVGTSMQERKKERKDEEKKEIGIFFSVKVFWAAPAPPTDSVSSVTLFVGSRQCVHPSTSIIHIPHIPPDKKTKRQKKDSVCA